MSGRQKWALIVLAAAYALVTVGAQWFVSNGAADRWQVAANVSAVVNSVALPVSLLVAILTLAPVAASKSESSLRDRDAEHDRVHAQTDDHERDRKPEPSTRAGGPHQGRAG